MLHKTSVVIVSIGAVAIVATAFGAELLAQENQPSQNSITAITADEYRTEADKILQAQQETMNARTEAWKNLSPAEKEEQLAQARARLAQQIASDSAAKEPEASSTDDTCFEGFQYPDREPRLEHILHDWEFIPLTFWGGSVKKTCVGVYAGYVPTDPARGALAVYGNFENSSQYQVYLTPTATGPVRIVSEENGILKLQSVAGTYDKDLMVPTKDGLTSVQVKTPGGGTYVFDLATKSYK
jgi:hypothetical protein